MPFSARSTLFVYVNVEVSLYRTEMIYHWTTLRAIPGIKINIFA